MCSPWDLFVGLEVKLSIQFGWIFHFLVTCCGILLAVCLLLYLIFPVPALSLLGSCADQIVCL
jgi:hypothetical protein